MLVETQLIQFCVHFFKIHFVLNFDLLLPAGFYSTGLLIKNIKRYN